MKSIPYILADPSGNTTAFITEQIPKEEQSALSKQLMGHDFSLAEQVAFLSLPEKQNDPIRIRMMGGEFCGNASRSSAACYLETLSRNEGTFLVDCSGAGTLLTAKARHIKNNLYEASIIMPLPASMSDIILPFLQNKAMTKVCFEGITHYVSIREDEEATLDDYIGAVKRLNDPSGAWGVILYDPSERTLLPAVYVAATDTLCYEKSCGSGSAALAACLAAKQKHSIRLTLRQPGGTMDVSAEFTDHLTSIIIGGPVKLHHKIWNP